MVGTNKMQQSNANRLIMVLSPFWCLVIFPTFPKIPAFPGNLLSQILFLCCYTNIIN
jgi:hypothetical protein